MEWYFTQEESEMSSEQFLYYWTMENIEIKEANIEGHENEYRMDTICSILKSMVSTIGNTQCFGILLSYPYCSQYSTSKSRKWKSVQFSKQK